MQPLCLHKKTHRLSGTTQKPAPVFVQVMNACRSLPMHLKALQTSWQQQAVNSLAATVSEDQHYAKHCIMQVVIRHASKVLPYEWHLAHGSMRISFGVRASAYVIFRRVEPDAHR